ncbi:MAG: LAGLIDADG family homing endonuclease [Patescibacteria group bacterium]
MRQKELLYGLYVLQNKTIGEVGKLLGVSQKTIFGRLKFLGIQTDPKRKKGYCNKRKDVSVPRKYTSQLAEFFGIMLGDGALSHFQVVVTLGDKEMEYAKYVAKLIKDVFVVNPKISIRRTGYKDVYFGSVDVTNWLFREGLVRNKVKSQVDAPSWIFKNKRFIKGFVRGFFDTDGSVYRLKYGIQISFSNSSAPLLRSLNHMLNHLGYKESRISGVRFYITKRSDVKRFFKEIAPKNPKHLNRFKNFQLSAGRPVGGGG